MERPKFVHVPRVDNYLGSNQRGHNVWQPDGRASPKPRSPSPRVTFGSPASDAGLRKGDQISSIGTHPARGMSHAQATDNIRHAGNTLNMSVQRSAGQAASPTPSSVSSAYGVVGVIPNIDPAPVHQLPMEQEKALYRTEKRKERQGCTNQPHRTFPMVQPKPKPVHDYPQGSYLRYMTDPNWTAPPKSTIHMSPAHPDKLKQVMSTIGGDPDKVVHLQYNSPINMYSQSSVAESVAPRRSPTNLAPSPARPAMTDFRQSPTFQLIQEQEVVRTHGPAKDHVYSPGSSPTPGAHAEQHGPAQSSTFKALRSSLLPHPDC